jgi:poly-gamma-glutamate capsule biosynthesis protein CapA/YwtB (metallophosphatase superfamily)
VGRKLTRREFLVLGAGAGLFAVVGCSPTQRAKIVGESSTSNQSGIASSGQDHSEEGTLLVPVTHLTSAQENITSEELSQTKDLAVPQQLSGTVGELLGRSSDEFGNFDSTTAVVGSVSRTPGAVGLVPWDAVSSEVKALGVDGNTLLAPGASELENYPLASGTAAAPDPKKLRRIVVGGDIVLDRGQNYMVIQQNMGLNFPLDGGYAAVTGRTPEPSDASEFGIIHQFTAERQGGAGKVRDYLRNANFMLANFENPVIKDAVWHPDATTFTGDLQLLPELNQAGIGGVTLGNNHIMGAGVPGLEETLGHLDEAGISHAGAGMNLEAAREPMLFDVGGLRVGVLSYQGVPSYEWSWASENNPGTTPLQEEVMKEDIKNLRPKVDFIIVMPHWGIEYTATPEPGQVEFAHAAMDAGADLLVGDHCHWPKGIEIYRGKPIFYGTGNFLFDQSWSEETSTGIFVEAILYEDRVVQARPVPFIVLDKAQPNFLVAEGGRDRALQTIFSASLGPEFETYKASSSDRQPDTE